MSIFDNIRTTHNPNEKGVVLTEEESVEFLNSLNASMDEALPKKIGMVHIKGVNDEAYQKFIDSQPKREGNYMISVVNNRW